MESREFVAEIRRRAEFEDADAVVRAARATLMTLGERLKGDQPRHLAAQLPPEFAQHLLGRGTGGGEQLTPKEFLERVSAREGVDQETARAHAVAIVEVLHKAVTGAEHTGTDYESLLGSLVRH